MGALIFIIIIFRYRSSLLRTKFLIINRFSYNYCTIFYWK